MSLDETLAYLSSVFREKSSSPVIVAHLANLVLVTRDWHVLKVLQQAKISYGIDISHIYDRVLDTCCLFANDNSM